MSLVLAVMVTQDWFFVAVARAAVSCCVPLLRLLPPSPQEAQLSIFSLRVLCREIAVVEEESSAPPVLEVSFCCIEWKSTIHPNACVVQDDVAQHDTDKLETARSIAPEAVCSLSLCSAPRVFATLDSAVAVSGAPSLTTSHGFATGDEEAGSRPLARAVQAEAEGPIVSAVQPDD